jgi:SAM-dependent methyltransferase
MRDHQSMIFPPLKGSEATSQTDLPPTSLTNQMGDRVLSYRWAAGLSDQEWIEFLAGERQIQGHTAPPLPPAELQRMFVGCDGILAFQMIAQFWKTVKEVISSGNHPLTNESKVLDFGVGWGRLYRYLLRDFSQFHLIGVDVDGSAIGICKNAMPYGSFYQVPTSPPYPFATSEFDLIALLSVFSHLSERVFKSILSEFGRIVKPGGWVAFTTLHAAHLNVWCQQVNQPYWDEILRKVDFNPTAWEEKLKSGEFLFVPTGGGDDSRPPDLYGEAIVSQSYLKMALLNSDFDLFYYSESPDAPQALAVLKRK